MIDVSHFALISGIGKISDDAFMKRFVKSKDWIVWLTQHILPNPIIRYKKPKWLEPYQVIVIDASCIEGLQFYRKERWKTPAAVQTATDTYRTDSGKIGNFINKCLTKTDKNSKAKDVYEPMQSGVKITVTVAKAKVISLWNFVSVQVNILYDKDICHVRMGT